MKILNIAEELKTPTDIIIGELGIENEDINIEFFPNSECIKIIKNHKDIKAYYTKKVEIFRILGIVKQHIKKQSYELKEKANFDTCGAMFDASRGAVPKVETIKNLIRKMAIMGMNLAMLYTEDTYEIDGYPYFGYLRGRYKEEELRICDNYADMFGIEMVPCIQTLGHMEKTLRWSHLAEIQNNQGCFLVGEPTTYEFIEKLITCATRPFKSKRIHIGMDEAYGVWLGNYFARNGLQNVFDILTTHLDSVMKITDKMNLKPMIWGDMFFCAGSKTNSYYDVDSVIPPEIYERIPKNLQLVYWDYYTNDYEKYKRMLEKHFEIGKTPLFAGGIWTWGSASVSYSKTFKTTKNALRACVDTGVKEVFATMWGDDGGEANIYSSLLGLQLYSEMNYNKNITNEELANSFKACTGCDFEAFMLLDENDFDEKYMASLNEPVTVSKEILFQDVLMGMFDKNFENINIKEFYEKKVKMVDSLDNQGEMQFLFDNLKITYDIMVDKCDIGINLKKAYDNNDKEKIKAYMNVIEKIKFNIEKLHISHRENWFYTNKSFGWNLHDIRYGGIILRLDTVLKLLNDYVNGKTDCIEELNEEKLLYGGGYIKEEKPLLACCSVDAIEIV